MRSIRSFCCAALLVLGACEKFPRDSGGTSDHASRGSFHVGLADGGPGPDAERLVARLVARTGGRPELRRGPAERLLMQVERGELDLVLGAFDEDSPWASRVTFSRPLSKIEGAHGAEEVKAATRNGEHAWSMTVDREIRAIEEASAK